MSTSEERSRRSNRRPSAASRCAALSGLFAFLAFALVASSAHAQSTTYHLHSEPVPEPGWSYIHQINNTNPDAAVQIFQTRDLRGISPGQFTFDKWVTPAWLPNAIGTMPAGSTISISLWMRKTTTGATIYPYAELYLHTYQLTRKATLCTASGTTELTPSFTLHQFSCTTTVAVTFDQSDRLEIQPGYRFTKKPNASVAVAFAVEGVAGGNYDSRFSIPQPPSPPSISAVTPTSGPVATPVAINGTNFGATQGASIVQFNGVAVVPTSWSATRIVVPVPPTTTAGPISVSVIVIGKTSTAAFIVTPFISGILPPAGPIGQSVTLTGTSFGTTQGGSTVTFGGLSTTPMAWSPTSVTLPVPDEATTGPVVVTVNNQASNAALFVVRPTITSISPTARHVGELVSIKGTNFGNTQGGSSVIFNGTQATATSWTDTAIQTLVPPAATSGPIVVTVSGQPSNGVPFVVVVPGSLQGTVTASGGSPLSGANVEALLAGVVGGAATTATGGTYSIATLDPGVYDVRVRASGYPTELRQNVAVAPQRTTMLDIGVGAAGVVSGRVTEADGVTPLAGAAVTIFSGPFPQASTHTDAAGDYAFADLHAGASVVQVVDAGYQTAEQAVSVDAGSLSTLNVAMNAAPPGPVQYAYDPLGRLVQVTDASGASAVYRYDAVGNITGIDRPGLASASPVTISGIAPISGPAGTPVTLTGTGFSTTAALNSVTLSGTVATVISATTTRLSLTVPGGASTGTFVVTTPTGSATGSMLFTVTADAGQPAITGLAPRVVAFGDTVVLTGANFEPVLSNNRVRLNGVPMGLLTGTAAALSVAVPLRLGGAVTIDTRNGTNSAPPDLYVVPAGYAASTVEWTGRTTAGASALVTLSANRVGLLLVDAIKGQGLSITASNSSIAASRLRVYRPDGQLLAASPSSFGASGYLDSHVVPLTGTYTVLVDPDAAYSGALTVTPILDVVGTIVSNGSSTPVTISSPGQRARLTFDGTAGQAVSVWTSTSTFPWCFSYTITIVKPDGTVLVSGGNPCDTSQVFIDRTGLPATGTYTMLIDPDVGWTGSMTLNLYTVVDRSGTIATDGVGVPVTIDTKGQNARLTFNGTAGQAVSLWTSTSTFPWCFTYTITLLKPTGAALASGSNLCDTSQIFIDQSVLPVTGTYTVLINPAVGWTGALTVNLYTVVDRSGPIAADGVGVPVTIDTRGQNARLTFTGTAGQVVSLRTSTSTFPFCYSYTLAILKSDGSALVNGSNPCGSSQAFIDQTILPASGTYTVLLDPDVGWTGSATLNLYTVVDVTGGLIVNGAGAVASMTVPGQNARYTFSGNAGQTVTLRASKLSWNGCYGFSLTILAPDASTVGSTTGCGTSGSLPATLPTSGTYTAILNPTGVFTGTATVAVTSP